MGRPREADGRMIVTHYPASLGRKTFFTSQGDDMSPTPPASGRGDGTQLRVKYEGTETGGDLTKVVSFQFNEPVEIHDGEFNWKPVDQFNGADMMSFSVEIPASSPSSTPGAGKLEPAPAFPAGHPLYGATRFKENSGGTGDFDSTDFDGTDVDTFTQLYPVKTVIPNSDGTEIRIGYWDADPLTGTLTPNSDGTGEFDFVNAGGTLVAYIVKNLAMGNPRGIFEIEAYRVEWFHQSWTCKMTVVKDATDWERYTTKGKCEANAWILTFRPGQS